MNVLFEKFCFSDPDIVLEKAFEGDNKFILSQISKKKKEQFQKEY